MNKVKPLQPNMPNFPRIILFLFSIVLPIIFQIDLEAEFGVDLAIKTAKAYNAKEAEQAKAEKAFETSNANQSKAPTPDNNPLNRPIPRQTLSAGNSSGLSAEQLEEKQKIETEIKAKKNQTALPGDVTLYLKKNGTSFRGKYISQDASSITLLIDQGSMTFQRKNISKTEGLPDSGQASVWDSVVEYFSSLFN
jgi:hypothetical protein